MKTAFVASRLVFIAHVPDRRMHLWVYGVVAVRFVGTKN